MKRREPQIISKEESTEVVALPQSSTTASSSLLPPPTTENSSPRKSSEGHNSSTTLEQPRRSTRVSTKKYSHDGDSWQETLAVCEMPRKDSSGSIKMVIRSYYCNQRTGERIWDEPPSGASRVMPATEEMRKMADVQLQEMQITFGGVVASSSEQQQQPPKGKASKMGFFRRSNKVDNNKEDVVAEEEPQLKIQYKPGSFLARVKKESSPKKKIARDDTLDPAIQKAIALSIADGGIQQRMDASQDDSIMEPATRSEIAHCRDEEETLQMAMALSLSEAESARRRARLTEEEMLRRASQRVASASAAASASASNIQAESQMSEEEMLDWAMKESKRSASSFKSPKVASLPVDDEMSCFTDDMNMDKSVPFRLPTKKSIDDFSDKKMPAKPSKTGGGVAKKSLNDFSDKKMPAKPSRTGGGVAKKSSDDFSDKKMPAKPSKTGDAHSGRTEQPIRVDGVLTRKSSNDFSDKKLAAKPSKTGDALGHSGRKEQPIRVDGESQPRSHGQPVSAGTSLESSKVASLAEPSMTRGYLVHSVRKKQPVGTINVLPSKPCSSKSSRVASLPVNDALSSTTDSNNDNSFRLPTKKSSHVFSDKKMPAEPSMTRGATGHVVRKKQAVGTNDVLKSQPRSYGQSSSARTNNSHGSESHYYERSSSGGSRRKLAQNESIPRETTHVESSSQERSSSRRA